MKISPGALTSFPVRTNRQPTLAFRLCGVQLFACKHDYLISYLDFLFDVFFILEIEKVILGPLEPEMLILTKVGRAKGPSEWL